MQVEPIIHAVAGRADDFLAEGTTPDEARAAITDLVRTENPRINAADRAKIIRGVMTILEREGFFEAVAGSGSFGEDGGDSKE